MYRCNFTLSSHTALINRSPPLPKSRLLSMKPAPMSTLQTSGNSPLSASSMSSSVGFSPAVSRARTVSTSPVLMASLRDLALTSGGFVDATIRAVLLSVRISPDRYGACGKRLSDSAVKPYCNMVNNIDHPRLLKMGINDDDLTAAAGGKDANAIRLVQLCCGTDSRFCTYCQLGPLFIMGKSRSRHDYLDDEKGPIIITFHQPSCYHLSLIAFRPHTLRGPV